VISRRPASGNLLDGVNILLLDAGRREATASGRDGEEPMLVDVGQREMYIFAVTFSLLA